MSFIKLGKGLLTSKIKGVPFSANIKITERCNLRCPICSIWRRGDKSREMDVTQLQKTSDNFKKLGLTRVVITGGEPFIRKDLPEIIAIFAQNGFSVTLLTNGLMGRPIILEQLFDCGLEHIGVSLDFISPQKQDSFYKLPGAWNRITAFIKNAVSLNRKGIVYIMATLMPENVAEILLLQRTAEAWGAAFVLNPVMSRNQSEPDRIFSGNAHTTPFKESSFPAVFKLYQELMKLKQNGHRILASNWYLTQSMRAVTAQEVSWQCHAGKYYFNVFSDGGVAPCNEFEPIILSYADDFVNQFWGEQFQNRAKEVRTTCSGCILGCWLELSALFDRPGILLSQSISLCKQQLKR